MEELVELSDTEEAAFNTLLNIAQTIGTHMLTIKLYERGGYHDEAYEVRQKNEKLTMHLDRLIDMYSNELKRSQ